jgi:LacI family transcriptional regulator, sucrose operon repressor
MSTLKDVADRSGVTVTTVSRMLNNRGYISTETRKKILKSMKELNYQPNEFARSLSKKNSTFIGLIVPSASNMFFSKIIDCTERYAQENGYKLLLCISNREGKKEIEYFNMLTANKVAGIILASHTDFLDTQIPGGAPVISFDHSISAKIPTICSDNYQGGMLAALHLIKKGCKHLAHISGSAKLNGFPNRRYMGFKEVCEKENIPFIVSDAPDDLFISMKYEGIIDLLLDSDPATDGIFASNDIIAAKVITACKKRNISVPEQMKVVGYDDIDLCTLFSPSITTIHQPIEEICSQAVKNIILFREKKIVPTNITLPVTLIERESTK